MTRSFRRPCIVWLPTAADTPLGEAMGGEGVVLMPYWSEEAEFTPDGIQFTHGAQALTLGILLASGEKKFVFGPLPSNEQLRKALRFAAADLGAASEDELCVHAAGHLRECLGLDHAVDALRRATEIVPDATLCRADLIAGLFLAATERRSAAGDALRDVARLFLEWQERDTARCGNEPLVFYCGFAAMAYLGRRDELSVLARRHRDRCERHPWLRGQVVRLRAARPRSLSAIAVRA